MIILPAGCALLLAFLLLMPLPGWVCPTLEPVNTLGGWVLFGLAVINLAVSLGPAHSTEIAGIIASEYAAAAPERASRPDKPVVLSSAPQESFRPIATVGTTLD